MTTTQTTAQPAPLDAVADERDDLLQTLATHRGFLRHTVRGLTDEQARRRTTVSELTLGGLVKHVAAMEAQWTAFVVDGPAAMQGEGGEAAWAGGFVLAPDETLAGVLAVYEQVAARTQELVRSLPDLGATQPLPPAPWFAPGARWSARRVLLHLVAETAQHAGHADLLRESLDGARTMG